MNCRDAFQTIFAGKKWEGRGNPINETNNEAVARSQLPRQFACRVEHRRVRQPRATKNLLPHCGKIAPPLDAKALRRIEQRLKRRDVAAFVIEPISINLGVLIPEKDAIRRVRDLCRRYGTLFIADEVASGFGRTGRLFACEHFDLDPDMLCVAKAMSGGLAPIGAVIATAPIAKSMEENDGAFYSPTAGTRAASPRRSRPCAISRRTGRGCSPALPR